VARWLLGHGATYRNHLNCVKIKLSRSQDIANLRLPSFVSEYISHYLMLKADAVNRFAGLLSFNKEVA
tara:strand:+ start:334 stop:537 length:204 start_codon:yes stop_codon:yes gene_type:complete